MADFKITFRFVGVDGSEWTEQYYKGNASNPTDAANADMGLIAARLDMLNKLNTFRSITAADVTANRVTTQRVLNLRGTQKDAPDFGPEVGEAAGVFNLVGANGSKRKLWLRGWTRGSFFRYKDTGIADIAPAMDAHAKGFFVGLKDNGYGIRKLKPITNPLNQLAQITSIDAVTLPGFATLTLDHALAFVNGGQALITKASRKDTPALNGTWVVTVIDATHIRIPYVPPRGVNLSAQIGTVRIKEYNAVDIFAPGLCGFDHYGSHDTKVPASHSRGARRAARIRQLA